MISFAEKSMLLATFASSPFINQGLPPAKRTCDHYHHQKGKAAQATGQ
jgi:hypothetical protein